MSSGGQSKISHLDGVRGVSVLMVMACHFCLAFFPFLYFGGAVPAHLALEQLLYLTPAQILIAGRFAVCIFFVLSGFVLSHHFFRTRDPRVATAGAVKRYFRLTPAVVVAALLSFALMAAGLYRNVDVAAVTGSTAWLGQSWLGDANFLEALKFGFYDAFFTGDNVMKYNNVLWTMRVELFGSLLVFALLAVFGTMRRRWIGYSLAALLLVNTYYLAFIAGLALCDWIVSRQRRGLSLGRSIFGWAALLEGLAIGTFTVLPPELEPARVFLYVAGACLIVAGICLVPSAQAGLARRPLTWVGEQSYALYLVHLPLLASVACLVFWWAQPLLGYKAAVVLGFTAWLPLTFGLAALITRYVDRPAIQLSGRGYRRIFEPPTAPAASPRPAAPAALPVSARALAKTTKPPTVHPS